ncbi:DNA topoisomerase 2 [Oleoguttula sp. CCFEE 5521]
MVLINGADGIGTGWSTSIPNYSPVEIIENLKLRMHGSKEDMRPMMPWFRGWTGETQVEGDARFKFTGRVTETGDCEVEITELPVRYWTQTFKDKLEDIIKAEKTPSFIKDYTEYNTPSKVHFIIKIEEKRWAEVSRGLVEAFKLSSTMSTTNLVAFDPEGRLAKYPTVLDIMEEFYAHRLKMYQKRKKYMLDEMQKDLECLSNQARFIKMIIDGKLIVSKKKKAALVAELQKLNFTRFPKIVDAKKEGEFEAVVTNNHEDDEDSVETAAGASDYDYLLGMAIWSLTQERVEKLLRQIGDKEDEITALSAKSPKDLWTTDLDALLEEWQTQLDEEVAREKKVRAKGRRASAKLGIGAGKGGSKKRKANEDSDDETDGSFAVSKKAKAAPKPAVKKAGATSNLLSMGLGLVNGVEQKPVVGPPAEQQQTLDSLVVRKAAVPVKSAVAALAAKSKPAAVVEELSDEDTEDVKPLKAAPARKAAMKPAARKVISDDEDDEEDAPPVKATSRNAAASKAKPARTAAIKDDEEDDSLLDSHTSAPPAPAPAAAATKPRAARAAAQKPKAYAHMIDSDEDASASDLPDVSAMVKGIGPPSTSEGATRFFHPATAGTAATSRPGSSTTAAAALAKAKAKKPVVEDDDISMDETDWGKLAQNSPHKVSDRTLLSEGGSDDEMEDVRLKPKPRATAAAKAPAQKPKAAAAAALKPKKAPAAAAAAPKALPLSPAAKAYAAKKAKQASAGAPPFTTATKAVPARRPASKLKQSILSDDDDGDMDASGDALVNDLLSDEDEDAAPVAAAARPSRRAAASKAKAKYAVSDDEEEEEESEAEFEEAEVDESF